MTKHKIAAFPFDVRPGEVATNLRAVLLAVEQADSGGAKLLADYSWYKSNSEKSTHPVGEKQANSLF